MSRFLKTESHYGRQLTVSKATPGSTMWSGLVATSAEWDIEAINWCETWLDDKATERPKRLNESLSSETDNSAETGNPKEEL